MAYEDYLLATYSTNLQGYWYLGANATDSSGNGNNGSTLNTAPTYGQTGIPGSDQNAARFGTNIGLRFEANPSAGASSPFAADVFTLVAWVKRLGNGTTISSGSGGHTALEPIIGKGMAQAEGSNLDANYLMGLVSSSGMKLAADFEEDTGPNHPVTGTVTVTDNAWHMLAVTYDGTWRLYVDGADSGTLSVSQSPESESLAAFVVGCGLRTTDADSAPQGAWNGDICHVAMWNTALDASDILDLYQHGNPPTPTATLLTTTPSLPPSTIQILLDDPDGPGIDHSSVSASDVIVVKGGVTLMEGDDYSFSYDSNGTITLTPLTASTWGTGAYEITLNAGS